MQTWNDLEEQDLWTLSADELALLPGMTDEGRLGFAVLLKFMQIHGRLPERHDELDPKATQWLATQLRTSIDGLADYELDGRQGRRHRRTIRVFRGFRPATLAYGRIELDMARHFGLPHDLYLCFVAPACAREGFDQGCSFDAETAAHGRLGHATAQGIENGVQLFAGNGWWAPTDTAATTRGGKARDIQ